jgi:LPXTG-motif cell wall-anchored protein
METNWFIVVGVVILAILLIVFLIKRNLKDERNYEKYLKKNDTPIGVNSDIDSEDL